MLNRCEFIGRLGADPEIRRTQDGRPIVNMRLAVSENWRDKNTGERKESTEWVSVVIFSEGLCKVAENYLRKGSLIYVAGAMKTRKWTDQSGTDKYATEIVMQGFDAKLVMLDKADGDRKPERTSYDEPETRGRSIPLDDDPEIPF